MDPGTPPDMLVILRALARTDVDQLRRDVGDVVRKAARDV